MAGQTRSSTCILLPAWPPEDLSRESLSLRMARCGMALVNALHMDEDKVEKGLVTWRDEQDKMGDESVARERMKAMHMRATLKMDVRSVPKKAPRGHHLKATTSARRKAKNKRDASVGSGAQVRELRRDRDRDTTGSK